MDLKFQSLPLDYVTSALRAGCGIKYDWVDQSEDDLTRLAQAAALGRARLVFFVPSGANIPIDKLEVLGRAGQGYVTMDFSQGN